MADHDMYCIALGAILKGLRTGRGMTLADVQEASGIRMPTLSRYESGYHKPKLATLVRITDCYETPLLGVLLAAVGLDQLNIDVPEDKQKALLKALLSYDEAGPTPQAPSGRYSPKMRRLQ